MHTVFLVKPSPSLTELDMMTQDALRFYKSHAVYSEFRGVVLNHEAGAWGWQGSDFAESRAVDGGGE